MRCSHDPSPHTPVTVRHHPLDIPPVPANAAHHYTVPPWHVLTVGGETYTNPQGVPLHLTVPLSGAVRVAPLGWFWRLVAWVTK